MEINKGLDRRDLGPIPGTLEKVSKVPTTVEVNAPSHGPAATVVEGGPWWPGRLTAELKTLGLIEPFHLWAGDVCKEPWHDRGSLVSD